MKNLSIKQKQELLALLEKREYYKKHNYMTGMYPDEGSLRRELYPKQLEFFRDGLTYSQRLFLAANRTGKSTSACYEITCHLTGRYPEWWEGRRFTKPVDVWVAGDTGKTVRDILQHILLNNSDFGTGMIPADCIGTYTKSMGLTASVDAINIKHSSGGLSSLGFKSYSSGRAVFQGTAKDIVLLDEEPDIGIYEECLLRTMTKNGMLLLTFTPLLGLTDLILSFQNADTDSGKKIITQTWEDVAHITPEQIATMLASLHPHQRDARSKGIPSLGSGVIYPVPPSDYEVTPFQIPDYYKKCFALDVGWSATACLWGAVDPDSGVRYIYSEHKQGGEQPLFHANEIKARGDWIPGVIDPASRGRSQNDGTQLMESYENFGLKINTANNAVQSGLYGVWEGLSTGKIKVFNNLPSFQHEIRLYRRDERGNIVKKDDHLMDCLRYLHNSGFDNATSKPVKKTKQFGIPSGGNGWMS